MDIKIKLEDETLCYGCPLDADALKCRGGFERETAKLVENKPQNYNPFYDIYTPGSGKAYLKCRPIRPRACLLANEHALLAIKTIPEAEKK